VAARMFSEEQLEQLRSFPDIGRDDLIRYFTLTQGPAVGDGLLPFLPTAVHP